MDLIQYSEVERIRKVSREEGCFSWTSEKYQNDILSYLFENSGHGNGVIEVGCYKGGLSAQLAFACKELNWPLYLLDIEVQHVKTTKNLLKRLGYGEGITFFTGAFDKFVQKVSLRNSPLLVVLDGDHRYEAVVKDIQSLYQLNKRSFSAAFHDFSLRHPTTGERVDRAVFDCFGDDIAFAPIGGQIRQETSISEFPDKINPSTNGHYWERPGSEGIIVKLQATFNMPFLSEAKNDPSVKQKIIQRFKLIRRKLNFPGR